MPAVCIFAGCYWQFVPTSSANAKLLNALLEGQNHPNGKGKRKCFKQDIMDLWTAQCQQAFDILKNKLIYVLVLLFVN